MRFHPWRNRFAGVGLRSPAKFGSAWRDRMVSLHFFRDPLDAVLVFLPSGVFVSSSGKIESAASLLLVTIRGLLYVSHVSLEVSYGR